MKKLKLYLETSVWNFLFADDAPEKKSITEEFFKDVEKYEIFISDAVIQEISSAEEEKKKILFSAVEKYKPTILEINEDIKDLSERYIRNGVIPRNKPADALHSAISTVYEMDALVTWNFEHLANIKKRDKINGVNLEMGYRKLLDIVSPEGVKEYES